MASPGQASMEWEKAKQVQISIDLVAATKQELRFLGTVDRQVLECAVARYLNCWLPLASKYTPSDALQPPLDCAWVWHYHKLDPVQYSKDCLQLFGKLVDVGPPGSNITIVATQVWTTAYPDVPYDFIRAGDDAAWQQQQKFHATIGYDLIAAIDRQTSFYYQVCRPWMSDDKYLKVALARYRGFLHLIKLAKEKEAKGGPRPFVVPTYDIDLLWHSRHLSPTAYRANTFFCMGTVLDHDDPDSDLEPNAKPQTSFGDTCQQWLATFGTVYEHAGSLYRGSEPTRAAPPTPNADPELRYPVNQLQLGQVRSQRQTVQVNLVVLGAANVNPTSKFGRRSRYFLKVSPLRKCADLNLTTAAVPCTRHEVTWNEGFSLQAELSTKVIGRFWSIGGEEFH